jgi:hypothetical protein
MIAAQPDGLKGIGRRTEKGKFGFCLSVHRGLSLSAAGKKDGEPGSTRASDFGQYRQRAYNARQALEQRALPPRVLAAAFEFDSA